MAMRVNLLVDRILKPVVFFRDAEFVCLFLVQKPPVGQGLFIHEVSRSHTTTHHSRQDSSGWVISSSQRPLPDNTLHSQQTNIHALSGIRTHNLSTRAATDLRLRLRGHWDRQRCRVAFKFQCNPLCKLRNSQFVIVWKTIAVGSTCS
jgi:hypothetical protein